MLAARLPSKLLITGTDVLDRGSIAAMAAYTLASSLSAASRVSSRNIDVDDDEYDDDKKEDLDEELELKVIAFMAAASAEVK